MLDAYAPCPCGSGKKIRFCCSKDLQAELDKLLRMIDGDQRVAALQQADRLLEKHGERMALLVIKASLQSQLGQDDPMKETVAKMRQLAPENPVALGMAAQLEAENDARKAFELLQDALDRVEGQIPLQLYETMLTVSFAMLGQLGFSAARALLTFTTGLGSRLQDSRPMELMEQVMRSNEVPVIAKREVGALAQPDEVGEVAWKEAYEGIYEKAQTARWRTAHQQVTALLEQHPDALELRRADAILLNRLGRTADAAAAFRKLTTHPELSKNDALEFEAFAQVVATDDDSEVWYDVQRTYEIGDVDPLMERLLSDKRLESFEAGPDHWVSAEDEPRPKAMFVLWDREPPTGDLESVQIDDLPRILLTFAVFGRQTDRAARLKVEIRENEDFEDSMKLLREVTGEALEDAIEREELGEVARGEGSLRWRVQIPREVPIDRKLELYEQIQRKRFFEEWLETPQTFLDGNLPRDVKDQAPYDLRLAAHALLTEVDGGPEMWEIAAAMRSELGIPEPEPITRTDDEELAATPATQLHRLQTDALSDEQLQNTMFQAYSYQAPRAIQTLAEAAVKRESTAPEVRVQFTGLLAGVYDVHTKALEILRAGAEKARAEGVSPGLLELRELEICLQRMDEERIRELLDQIARNYSNDPKIGPAFVQLLMRYGLIGQDGSAPMPGGGMPGGEAADPLGGGAAESGGIWTPDQGTGSAGGGGEESSGKGKLYLPGMD